MARDPAPQGGRHRDRLHQPQAPRGAPGGRPDHRAAPRQADGHRPARGRHRAQPGPARRRPRRAAGRRQAGLRSPGEPLLESTTCTSATTASCPPSTGSRCRCAPGRSSPWPASTATASRSWSRRSPGCASRSRARSPSTGTRSAARGVRAATEAGIAHIAEDRHRRGLVLPFTLTENMALREYRRPLFSARGWLRLRRMRDRARPAAARVRRPRRRARGVRRRPVGRQPAEGVRRPRDRV